ncbi:hypothetical protein EGH67_17330 [Klebsiella aerogenes]|nr:hypothetical protein [Klebsiella aerogenes]DAI97019.1 MAG TPA: hypothetical protein [Caudoviricetes sp.]RSV63343.1 hypothetical protein EGH59_26665 [Klebsiella aerogenes]RSV65649.1 hypothetical protein EGH60_24040 [Klebsiella aerogenes]RSV70816.1 hypothetical protein EGH58_25025 [Klebsiella aerogenes]
MSKNGIRSLVISLIIGLLFWVAVFITIKGLIHDRFQTQTSAPAGHPPELVRGKSSPALLPVSPERKPRG